jgi:hypothetical protein
VRFSALVINKWQYPKCLRRETSKPAIIKHQPPYLLYSRGLASPLRTYEKSALGECLLSSSPESPLMNTQEFCNADGFLCAKPDADYSTYT